MVPSELPGGTVATTVHTGAYDEVGAAYAAGLSIDLLREPPAVHPSLTPEAARAIPG